jgi:methyltransferase (TIGR00027 family)
MPPVECCRGTSRSQAAKSRPFVNARPLPTAATSAVAEIGPTPCTTGEMDAFVERRIREGLELGVPPGDPQAVLARTLRVITPASSVLARARYAEDRLTTAVAQGVGKYVLVGAGLHTFAFRRTDMREHLRVFERDHPQSQAAKRKRLAAAGLTEPPNLHFSAIDFEREGVAEALGRLPFRVDQPAVFAWLGVTMYLTRAAIDGTWRGLRSVAAAGSELVFDFIHRESLSGTAAASARRLLDRLRAIGELMIAGLNSVTLGADLGATGWMLVEQLDAAEVDRRYFAMRSDG